MALRERLMLVGDTGTGKSYSCLTLARELAPTPFYFIDTDDSVDRLLFTEFKGLTNVYPYPSSSWEKCEKSLEDISSKVKEGDWLVIDMLCSTWDFVQSYFVEQVFGKKIDDYFLEVRKTMKIGATRLDGLKGWVDWGVINKIYQDWVNKIMYQLPCHVAATSKVTSLMTTDEPEIRSLFSSLGIKPEGEKRNSYRVHTILLTAHDKNGWYISTIKDRGRRQLNKVQITNFAIQYGLAVAGWSIP